MFILLVIPAAFVWMLITGRFTFESFAIGVVVGAIVLSIAEGLPRRLATLPKQLAAFALYTVRLLIDIVLSGVKVAQIVLDPKLPIKTGILRVETHSTDEGIAAVSAHGITITPGQLVVDFDVDNSAMYVHCLDIESSMATSDADQRARLVLINRMLLVPSAAPALKDATEEVPQNG